MTALATAAFFAFGSLLVLFGANGNEIVEALELDDERLGLVGAMLSLGLGGGILVAGPLVDRVRRRPLFVAACALVALASGTLSATTSFAFLLAHTAVIGFGAGFYETLLNAVLVEGGGRQATRRLLFVHAAATLGASFTPLLIGGLRSAFELSWIDAFRLAGGLHVAIALAGVVIPWPMRDAKAGNASARPGQTGGQPPVAELRPRRRRDPIALTMVCLAMFVYVGIESAFTLFIARFAKVELVLEAARGQAAISAFWAGLLIGRLVAGLLPRSPGAGSIAGSAAVAALAVGALGGGWLASPELAMGLAGLMLGIVFPVMIALAGAAWPDRPGTAVGLAAGIGSLGGFVIPWLTGRIALTTDLTGALLSLGAWTLVLTAAAATVRLRLGGSR